MVNSVERSWSSSCIRWLVASKPTFWENKYGSRNVGLLAVQPPDAAASLRKSYCILFPWKLQIINHVLEIWSFHSWKYKSQSSG